MELEAVSSRIHVKPVVELDPEFGVPVLGSITTAP
jgi:hypothetical protein